MNSLSVFGLFVPVSAVFISKSQTFLQSVVLIMMQSQQ